MLAAIVASLLKGVVDRRYHAHLQLVVKDVESRFQGAPDILAIVPFLLVLVAHIAVLSVRRLDLVEVRVVAQQRAVIVAHLLVSCSHVREVNLQIGLGLRVLDRLAVSRR